MNLVKIVEKAMIDSDIETMKQLADKAGISYYKVSGFINSDESIKLIDLKSMLEALDLKIKFVDKGE